MSLTSSAGGPVGGPVGRPASYGVVVPVKALALAKSRLASLGDDVRRDLMVAFVVDTVTAALESTVVARVLVVTDDLSLARGLGDLGVAAIPDGDTADLNASLVQGAAELVRRHPELRPVALCGDLPSLRAEELTAVLDESTAHARSFVSDAAGTGTTLYTAVSLDDFAPRFGIASRRAHLDTGAVEIGAGHAPSVRQDVDTPEDLDAALVLGVGARTAWVALQAGLS